MEVNIALIGDFRSGVTAHRAINASFSKAEYEIETKVSGIWLATDRIDLHSLKGYSAVWCVPASPYKNTDNALAAIRHARETGKPFLGTCGGYQHAALEYARNVLRYTQADNTEINPYCDMPLISSLACRLVEEKDRVSVKPGTKLAAIYNTAESEEAYHCSYGINKAYLAIYDDSGMQFSAHDMAGEPKALELADHPFFIGTAFQPERSALDGKLHPIVKAFFTACL